MRGIAAALLIVAACRSAPRGEAHDLPPPDQDPIAVDDEEGLKADLRSTVLESYRALSAGYEEAYIDGLAHDARLLLIDVDPGDVVVGYEPAACQHRSQLLGQKVELVSKLLEVHLSADHTVAWTFDEISVRLTHDGLRVAIPLRSTAIYERRDGRWMLLMEHLSYGIPDDDALAEASRITPGKAMPDDTPPGAVAAEARRAVQALIDDASGAPTVGDDALIVGSDPDRELHGKDQIAALAPVRALYGSDFTARSTGLRVQVSRSGTVAWAAANLRLEGEGGKPSLPLRATWVLEKRGAGWTLVQAHYSVPVTDDELAARVFGEETATL